MFSNINGKNFSKFLPEGDRSKDILPAAIVFCLQFQLLGLELYGQPVPLMAGNKNSLSCGTESRSRQAVTRLRAAAEKGH